MSNVSPQYIHKQLASGRWYNLSFTEQMANIGSDVMRALKRQKQNDYKGMESAIDRFLELMILTISDDKNHTRGRLKELTRMKELLLDYFYAGNTYSSTPEFFQKYFDYFAFRVAAEKKR